MWYRTDTLLFSLSQLQSSRGYIRLKKDSFATLRRSARAGKRTVDVHRILDPGGLCLGCVSLCWMLMDIGSSLLVDKALRVVSCWETGLD